MHAPCQHFPSLVAILHSFIPCDPISVPKLPAHLLTPLLTICEVTHISDRIPVVLRGDLMRLLYAANAVMRRLAKAHVAAA